MRLNEVIMVGDFILTEYILQYVNTNSATVHNIIKIKTVIVTFFYDLFANTEYNYPNYRRVVAALENISNSHRLHENTILEHLSFINWRHFLAVYDKCTQDVGRYTFVPTIYLLSSRVRYLLIEQVFLRVYFVVLCIEYL